MRRIYFVAMEPVHPRTTVVGSYPVPRWLQAQPSAPNLRDAMMVILKTQEIAGIDVLADGELSRFDPSHPETNGMIDYFIRPLDGVSERLSAEELRRFRSDSSMGFRSRPPGVVRGPVGPGTMDLSEAFHAVRGLTTLPLKFTLTSPYMLAKTLLDAHYGDLRELTMDIARVLRAQVEAIDAEVVQIDEANLPGHAEDADWAHEPINHVLDGVSTERALHLCFGNYGGQSIQSGRYAGLLDFLGRLHVDHLVLEVARRDPGELEVFRDLDPRIAIGVGVIDIKDNEIETPEVVAARIEGAVSTLGGGRVGWVHPDCGFWMLLRTVADGKMRALVQGRDLFLGRPTESS